jgi:hypothetical protein
MTELWQQNQMTDRLEKECVKIFADEVEIHRKI